MKKERITLDDVRHDINICADMTMEYIYQAILEALPKIENKRQDEILFIFTDIMTQKKKELKEALALIT